MKKRIFALLLIAAMSFSLLAGCGSKDDEKTPETNNPETSAPTENQDPAFGADLAEFYNKIMAAAEEGPFMMDIAAEAEMLEANYPGLKDIETKQLVAFAPAMSAVAIEFAFVEVANAADVETVKTIFQTRIDNQVNGGAWYPETIEGWQNNSEIVVIDNYVCLFVCAEKDGMIDALRNGTEVPVWAKAQAPAEGDIEGGIMDMPVEDGPAAYDPEAETSTAPVAPPADLDHDIEVEDSTPAVEPSTPAVNPEPAPEVKPETPAATSIDLAEFYYGLYETLYPVDADGYSTGPFVEDFAQAPEMLDGFYPGLTAIAAKQMHVYMPMMSGVPYEVVLVEVENSSDVEAVKTILQARIDTEKSNQFAYPMVTENWELNSRIVTNGNYIMMVVSSDYQAYIDAFNAQF